MKQFNKAINAAKRMRNHCMMLEIGYEKAANALTRNIEHSLIALVYETH